MGNTFGTVVLVVTMLFCLLTTLSAGARPDRFAQQLGLKIVNAGRDKRGLRAIRRIFLAVAVICLAALLGQVPRAAAYMLLIAVFGGLIAGRAFSFMANGGLAGFTPMIIALYAIDAIGLLVSATALAFDRT